MEAIDMTSFKNTWHFVSLDSVVLFALVLQTNTRVNTYTTSASICASTYKKNK